MNYIRSKDFAKLNELKKSELDMPRKKGTASQSTSKVCCAVCLNDVKTDDMATCTECKKMAHRYCDGVPMDEFKAADGTYTCLSA